MTHSQDQAELRAIPAAAAGGRGIRGRGKDWRYDSSDSVPYIHDVCKLRRRETGGRVLRHLSNHSCMLPNTDECFSVRQDTAGIVQQSADVGRECR